MKRPAPVVVFAFNRPDHLERTLRALEQCPEAPQTQVYVRIDGPRDAHDHQAQKQIHSLLQQQFRFGELKIHTAEKNRGLANSLIAGITELVERFGEIIVLEDDLVVSPVFLKYMNFYLEKYRHEEKVISIHGYCYPIAGLPEAFFIRGADCWGWATWARGWKLFDADGARLLAELKGRGLEREFDFDNSYPYVKMLKDQIAGRVSSWAIRWNASAFLADKLTLYPGRSLVQNIGMDGSGTHTGPTASFDTKLAENFNPQSPLLRQDPMAREKFKGYFRTLRPSFPVRVLRRVGRLWHSHA